MQAHIPSGPVSALDLTVATDPLDGRLVVLYVRKRGREEHDTVTLTPDEARHFAKCLSVAADVADLA